VPRFRLPPKGSLAPNNEVDPLRYYYAPLVGRAFVARLDLGLALLDGRVGRALEIGYGSGLLLPTLSAIADVVDGIDLASEPADVREAVGRLGVRNLGYLVRGSAARLPFPTGGHDLVVAFSILEHLEGDDLRHTLSEVARELRPGGRFLIGLPAVHKAMNLAFAAIGFRGIEHHHVSGARQVLEAAAPHFSVEKRATWPAPLPLSLAPYSALLLRRS
jgi:SAM-dependent methyltransferase